MKANAAKVVIGVVWIFAVGVNLLSAQNATLTGVVTDPAGKPMAHANVTIKNVTTGQSFDTETDSAGHYSVPNLAAGEYQVSSSLEGAGSGTAKAMLGSEGEQTVNLSLAPGPAASEQSPNAPSSSKTEPSLEDLGFSKVERQSNPQQQALLDKRTHMLKIHQRMGLITAAPLIASVITSINAGGKSEGTASRDLHVALGSLTGDLYGITAYYAIRAPRIQGTETRGPIKVHKILAWVHGPGMILTPILGAMAFEQKNNGQKVHGIAQAHGPVAIVTAGAFGAALLSVSVKF